MTDDKPSSAAPGEPPRRRRVPPPTIDLEATDVSTPTDSSAASAPPPAGEGEAAAESGSAPRAPHEPAGDAASSGPAAPFTSKEEPRSAPPRADSPRDREEARTAVAAAGLIPSWLHFAAGALGAALALIVALGLWVLLGRGDQGALNDRLARIEAQLGTAAQRNTSTGANSADAKALADRLAAIENEIRPLAARLGDLDRRDAEATAAARTAREGADAAAKSLADVAQQLAQLNAERARAPTAERADLAALATRLAGLEASTKTINDQLGRLASAPAAGNTREAVVALALKSAVDRGVPYERELDAIRPFADAGTIAALEPFARSGVPSAATLAHEAAALVPALVTAADAPAPAGVMDRLWQNAKRTIRLRPVGEVPGNDSTAVIARLETKALHNDVDGALAEAGNLPSATRGPIEPWIKRAQGRAAALAAADRIATATLDRIGRNASQGAAAR